MQNVSTNKIISPPEFEHSRLVWLVNALKTDIRQLKRSIKDVESLYHESFNNECILEDKLNDLHDINVLIEKNVKDQENKIKKLVDQAKHNNERLQYLLMVLLMTIATALFLYPLLEEKAPLNSLMSLSNNIINLWN